MKCWSDIAFVNNTSKILKTIKQDTETHFWWSLQLRQNPEGSITIIITRLKRPLTNVTKARAATQIPWPMHICQSEQKRFQHLNNNKAQLTLLSATRNIKMQTCTLIIKNHRPITTEKKKQ